MTNLKEEWVGALRSGSYTQTEGALNDGVGFCCLGVLCNVKDSNSWERDDCDFDGDFLPEDELGNFEWGGCESFAPEELMEEVFGEGLEQDAQKVQEVQDHLSTLNDNGKFTFDQIATLVEQGPEAIKKAYDAHMTPKGL